MTETRLVSPELSPIGLPRLFINQDAGIPEVALQVSGLSTEQKHLFYLELDKKMSKHPSTIYPKLYFWNGTQIVGRRSLDLVTGTQEVVKVFYYPDQITTTVMSFDDQGRMTENHQLIAKNRGTSISIQLDENLVGYVQVEPDRIQVFYRDLVRQSEIQIESQSQGILITKVHNDVASEPVMIPPSPHEDALLTFFLLESLNCAAYHPCLAGG
jgi:hypothetical protein